MTTATAHLPITHTLEMIHDLASIRSEWSALAEQTTNVFSTWEWADAWRRHLGGDRELAVAVVRRADGSAGAVLPLYVAMRRPVRVLRFIGAEPADELGPVCAPGEVDGIVGELRRHALSAAGAGGVFVADKLPAGLAERVGGTPLRTAASPVVRIDGAGFEDYMATRSRNFRSQFRRAERRLAREHRLEYRITSSPDELARDMRTLIALHEQRWSAAPTRSFSGAYADFHLDFAARALANGWLRLWTLELDGRPAAAWYGLRFGGAEHYYQAGRDPALGALKVGFVLLCHTIRAACEDGMDEYRFGFGGEEYKSRFATDEPALETVALAGGARGRLALAGLRAGLRTRDAVRARRAAAGEGEASSSSE